MNSYYLTASISDILYLLTDNVEILMVIFALAGIFCVIRMVITALISDYGSSHEDAEDCSEDEAEGEDDEEEAVEGQQKKSQRTGEPWEQPSSHRCKQKGKHRSWKERDPWDD